MLRYLHGAHGGSAARAERAERADENVHAVVYRWTLSGVPSEHPLFGIVYIGQVVRSGHSPEEALHFRTMQHCSDAIRSPRELGLHWAIRTFGRDSFSVQLVDTRHLPRVEAMDWANERERALIAAHGGVMRDRDRRRRQTLNLTVGGQGNPRAVWQGLEAHSNLRWTRLQAHLQAFYEDHKHLRVPHRDTTPCGYRLGVAVINIRTRKDYITGHPERVAWLEERGFAWNERDASWTDLQRHLQAFYDDHGHLRVPQKGTTPCGYRLGKAVNTIRSHNAYITGHPERVAWLEERGFAWNERDASWTDLQRHLQAFYDDHGHLRVPQKGTTPCGYRLGKAVNTIRSHNAYITGHPERVAWLRERGFRMHATNDIEDANRWRALEVEEQMTATP